MRGESGSRTESLPDTYDIRIIFVMLFTSSAFFIFLLITLIIYWSLSSKPVLQNVFLLLANCFFYGWLNWRFLFLLGMVVITSYWAGRLIDDNLRSDNAIAAKKWLIVSVLFDVGILVFFKYYNYFERSVCLAIGADPHSATIELLVPIGISFYIFMAMGYVFDVWRRTYTLSPSFLQYALFLSFFPQLLAGPISRVQSLLPQFEHRRKWNTEHLVCGVELFALGLFKKIVVADRLIQYVNNVFDKTIYQNRYSIVIAVFFFTIQIYCDFSGYTDMARGTAKLFGIELMENFRLPYFAETVGEFWRKWHISLSTWFRDYLYFPLGGNRVSKIKNIRNIMIVFLTSGLWHGANWTFVVWGGLHGVFLVMERLSGYVANTSGSPKAFSVSLTRRIVTFVAVAFAWIFFRADSIPHAWILIRRVFCDKSSFVLMQLCAGLGPMKLINCILTIGLLCVFDLLFTRASKKFCYRVVFLTLLLSILFFEGVMSDAEFIYFQF